MYKYLCQKLELKDSLEVATDGSICFNLTSANTQVIGTSQMYTSTQRRDNGIASARNSSLKAYIFEAIEAERVGLKVIFQ
jgi:uncharacterized protein YegP (UPF0339 family)